MGNSLCSCVKLVRGCEDDCHHDFLANVSHELRTPITALTGYGELLLDGVYGPLSPSQEETVDRMRKVAHQLSTFVEGLLVYANIQAGRERTVVAPGFLVSEVVSDAILAVESYAKTKGVRLEGAVCEPLSVMKTDREKIRQILVFTLENAIKFSSDEKPVKRVEIVASRIGDSISFSIIDNGIGIEPEFHEEIFENFMQVETGLTRRHGGVGLGLFISRELAYMLGGTIDVESEPGVGSTFTLVVPATFLPS